MSDSQSVEPNHGDLPDLQAAHVRELWFRLSSEASEDGVLLHRDGIILDLNDAMAAMFGYTDKELEGRHLLDLLAEESRTPALDVLRTGHEGRFEGVGTKKCGASFPFEAHGRNLHRNGHKFRLAIFRDLTRKKQREAQLRESADRFCALAEAARDMIFTVGRDGIVQYVNSVFAASLGLEPKEIMGKPYARLFPCNQSEPRAAAIAEALATGNPSNRESVATLQGRESWIETWLTPIRNQAGEVVAVQGISRDITDRIRTEEKLRQQSAALESAANGIVITDREGKVVWVNPAFVRLTGYTSEEMVGHSLRLLKSDRHRPEFYGAIWKTILAGQVWQGEIINYRKDGSCYTLEQTITPVQDAKGVITHFIAIQQDITERKHMEVELRASRQRFAKMFEANPEAIVISSAHTGCILDVNDGFLVPLGFKREEVIGRTAQELRLFADDGDREALRARLRKEGRVRNFAVRFRGRSGREFDVLISAEPIQLGSESCVLVIANDITHWKHQQAEMEDRLRRAQKLESIGTLAGGIAHDFNNILTIIQGHAALILEDGKLPPSTLESLKQIAQATERAANLTRQLLTFSRKQPMQRRLLDLGDVVGTMTKMLCRLIGEDITLQIRCAENLPAVLADVGMMEQVVMNLAINARDAIHARRPPPAPGEITLCTERVMTHPPTELEDAGGELNEYVCLKVADNGCGIPPEILNRIFDPFFTTKEVGKGTGLGLATVHGIIQEHHGWIDVESHPRQGSTFRIYLPASRREAQPVREPRILQRVPGGSETILLVEDEEALRHLATEVLERYGYRVLSANSGQEALHIWETHADSIDLLLTDIVMPEGISGRQLAEMLDAKKPGLKVIYSTGYSPEVHGWEFMRADGVWFLQKPYPPHELAQIVRSCLDNNTTRD